MEVTFDDDFINQLAMVWCVETLHGEFIRVIKDASFNWSRVELYLRKGMV
jgi:hypothetical protein